MNKIVKQEYDALKKSGDLLDMFPDLTGSWSKDKKEFTNYWESNQQILSDMDVIIEDDFEEDF